MKKNKVDEILKVQVGRKRKIIGFSILIVLLAVVLISLIVLIFNLNKTYIVQYEEKSNVDYKVYLKDNEFYKNNYLDENSEYVVSLIDYIDAYFDYSLNLEETNISYDYRYKVDAELNIKTEDSDNSLFTNTDVLVEETFVNDYEENNLNINKNVRIDYNKYNDLVKRFVEVYGLQDVDSELIVRMHIEIMDNCIDGTKVNEDNEYIVELEIPLNVKTIDINMNSDVVDLNNNLMICDRDDNLVFIISLIVLWIGILLVFVVIKMTKYILNSRTPESVYEAELRKILSNYKSYIQKINTVVDFNAYKVLKVDTFTDMLEIRDTVQQPILMSEDQYKRGTYFMIPTNTKIMYVYGLKVNDIKKEMNKRNS